MFKFSIQLDPNRLAGNRGGNQRKEMNIWSIRLAVPKQNVQKFSYSEFWIVCKEGGGDQISL